MDLDLMVVRYRQAGGDLGLVVVDVFGGKDFVGKFDLNQNDYEDFGSNLLN